MNGRRQGKIFGIGLSRTGTCSLNDALELLGYASVHFPDIQENICNADYDLEVLRRADAITDSPVAPIFPQLDRAYPGSKFVLTVREKEAWLAACERWYKMKDELWAGTEYEDVPKFNRLFVYGCVRFSRERFSYVYDRHLREVRHHFAGRPYDLLLIDICAGEGWEKLCPFLGAEIPDEPFPHSNTLECEAARARVTRLLRATEGRRPPVRWPGSAR
ncbi:MAG: sulfotransferase family protein [Gammaproteobacteria bacterium]|nr:sulfotransferase family protein [Gammaproteobacteria bacterium]NIR81737.1 sulfotransferase family protein [Gammaproteobacteria bacterium]NIR88540.1 sulfotransferase family protein [Gammaproteobacteria bacterium]NIU02844.1 sulfotransferase family protein [Gammaproteobacteria bacterium]NIV50366.1 sulfotransferase family protein [Gammaproteobacteria bacterium]